jgi:hypothetical protein
MAWELCTKEDVQALYPIEESDLLAIHSDLVEGLIREYMGAPYLGTTSVITDEYYNGNGSDTLMVKKPLIVSVQSLMIDSAVVDPSTYIVGTHKIQLLSGVFTAGRANIILDYTSGSSIVPTSVRMAAISMMIALINYQGRQGADGSIIWGVPAETTQEGGERSPSFNIGLISHLKRIMVGLLKREKVRIS